MTFRKYIVKDAQQIIFTFGTFLFVIFGIGLFISGESPLCLFACVPFFGNLIGDYVTYKKAIRDGIFNKEE